ncbi:phospholipid-translocating P-type ATPase [Polychaeton citri CBS 116435]|uniref:Phospholipid-transporting ATPase n=1 Tax=Polychaeton citri CBS 116435 TaxID=1314669 RepID=A0A9P4UKB9_9PEZI|nr:phospholipid-translocating P-type ATPase [Polychaeton citri CBS 116435]
MTSLSRQSVDHGQRVRFSVDEDRSRSTGARHKKRNSDEIAEHKDGLEEEDGEQNKGHSLSIDTRVASILGKPAVKSPVSVVSPGSPPAPGPLRSQTMPARRASRNRGLSLRSSLFNRNLLQRSTSDDWVEMQGVSSNNERPATGGHGKKGSQPSIQVTSVSAPYDDDDDSVDATFRRGRIRLPDKGIRGAAVLPNYQEWMQRQAHRHLPVKRIRETYSKARKFLFRIKEIPPSKDGRHIMSDPSRKKALIDERTNKPYTENWIRSTRYSAWNFVPRQLLAQFSKLANFYFLCVAILQMIPGLSTTGTYTTIVPLLFFVSISIAKEGYDDLRRYRLDKAENRREANVMHAYRPIGGTDTHNTNDTASERLVDGQGLIHWAPVKWQSIQVGDVIKLERDQPCPADLVLLHSNGPNGIAYVETMALDGETNLKPKQAPPNLARTVQGASDIASRKPEFVVEDPNLDLYNFEGKVTMDGETAPVTNNEVLYRGSILRNTPTAIGMVIYSGEECKIRMNANKNPRIKAPALQSVVNKIVVVIVIFVIALALFNTIAYQIWANTTEDKLWYLTNASVGFGPVLTSFIIMFNTMIPLSLYVSMEIIKLAQMVLLNDIDMYDEVSNTPFEPRTSTINEELGQISYVFSDKTGTLTENIMRFRKLSVAGTAWLHDVDLPSAPEQMLVHKKRNPKKHKSKGKKPMRDIARLSLSAAATQHATDGGTDFDADIPRTSTSQWHSSARPHKAQPELPTSEMIRYIQRQPRTVFARKARMLILSMAVCHTCLPERGEGSEEVNFQASSPDELALVEAAKELGFLAFDREVSTLTLKLYPHGLEGEPLFERYDILDIIEFSSKRKRMSVVVRFPDGRICVLCKGADSVIMQRLRLSTFANERMNEIEKRANARKSIEAQHALTRKSAQIERSGSVGSFPRTSVALSRNSVSRPSVGRLAPIRDEVDSWLNEREREVDASPQDDSAYTPRPSAQLARASMAHSERRSSASSAWQDEELVEESLAMDEHAVVERCLQHINDFATEGLRTLLFGFRFLEEEEYKSWKKIYHDATTSLVDRQLLIERAGEIVEQRLELSGATAIEDKLQQGVPETIDKLRRADIKMWMLTGDKRETAINIGHSCRLIKDYSSVTILDEEVGDVEQNIAATVIDINRGGVAHSVVVVDGQTLATIETDEYLHMLFLDLAVIADSVVCCRASPSQKAGLVNSIRKKVKKSVTLAIGDGANDIAMIQEAHVGIGITGKEGLQAARTSDYSVAQFRFLTKLLLVHGRWNYLRTAKYTVATFWKEMFFYLTQALYQRWNGYTGTSLYESWSLSMFNTLFTSLPVIFLGIFEKDLLSSTLIAVPELYSKGQRNGAFNFWIFLAWMFMASAEAMITYFTMFTLYGDIHFTKDNGLFAMGDLTFTVCITIIAFKLQFTEIHNKSVMAAVSIFASVGGWYLWNLILSQTYSDNTTYNVLGGFTQRFGANILWWLVVILACSSCMLLEVVVRSVKAAFFPTDVEAFQTLEKDLAIRKRFEEASALFLQAGWHHGSKKSSLELLREEETQQKREQEVADLLQRPRTMEDSHRSPRKSSVVVETQETPIIMDEEVGPGGTRRSIDIQEMLSRRYGNVRQGSLTPMPRHE